MLPDEAGLIGISAGIVDRADGVERRAVGGEGMARDGNDNGVAVETQQFAVFIAGAAGNQPLCRACNEKAVFVKEAV